MSKPDHLPGFTHDVAIVGCGPVGALLANLLGQAGVSVIVLERDAHIHRLPRAVHFDGEIMRIFQAAGRAAEVAKIARPSNKGMHFINAVGETLLVRRGIDGPGPQGWVNNWYVHQPLLDAILRSGLKRFATVDLRTGHTVTALHEDPSAVRLTVQSPAPDSQYVVSAHYVVGCDGARSLVRQTMESTLENLGLHQPWLVVDLVMQFGSQRAQMLPDHTIQLCDPARPMTLVNVGGLRRRWEIMLLPGDDPQAMLAPERIRELLSRWISPEDAEIERAAVYTFHAVIARGWRRGRLLLAGDSCHQTPPFLGQGLCAGLRDAANLGWKLARIVRSGASDGLLDTYESERRPHVETFINLAVELGGIIQITDPVKAAERDSQFLSGAPRMFDFPLPQLGPGLLDAGLKRPVGVIFPQPRLTDGRLYDEIVGNRFALFSGQSAVPGLDAAMMARLAANDVVVLADEGAELRDWLRACDAHAVLVRPDRYVLGLVRSDDDLQRLAALLPASPSG